MQKEKIQLCNTFYETYARISSSGFISDADEQILKDITQQDFLNQEQQDMIQRVYYTLRRNNQSLSLK